MGKINRISFGFFIFSLIALGMIGQSLAQSNPTVTLIVDADLVPGYGPDDVKTAGGSLIKLINEIDPNGRNVTIFVSGEMASAYRLGVTSQGTMSNHELALYGNNTGENLAALSAVEQKALLEDANDRLYHCYVCGGKHVNIKGFRPQGFEQNEDTLHALENLSIIYDAGFQEGLIYVPGHENDTWPYLIDGFKLYAVPVSTAALNGELVPLYDKYAKEDLQLTSAQWQELLQSKFDESSKAGNPMVVIFSNLVSGNSDYLDAYRGFLDYAQSGGATFVTALQLVDMAVARNPEIAIPELEQARSGGAYVSPSEKGSVADCPTCDQAASGKSTSIIAFSVKKSKACPTCNQSQNNSTSALPSS